MQINKKNKLLIITNLFLLAVVIFLTVIIFTAPKYKNNIVISRDKNNQSLLTNPILDCEIENTGDSLVLFSGDINSKVDQIKNKYSLEHISLYFRDLNNGSWIGIKEKEVFSPASLLKVPLFMAFLKDAESNPSILDKKITILESDVNRAFNQNIVFPDSLSVGEEYSLLDISKSMIEKSDNTAVSVLFKNIYPKNIENVFRSVGVPFKDLTTEVDLRVKDYAGFFRVLFNSSYLNREMSEKALDILSNSEYKNGIVAGVPSNIKVAHKFGERSISGREDSTQLHDCGIVYYPENPYIICIMTRGNDFKIQERVIGELSSYVYSEIEKSNK